MRISNLIANLIVPFSPAIVFLIRQRIEQNKSMNRLTRVKGAVESEWKSILLGGRDEIHLTNVSRNIQDGLYTLRKDSPLVFDWIYKIYRNEQQENTEYSV